ncbi:hypothetical protein ACFL6S_34495, partial [Candidatus Poribacteria bacterium]
MSNDRFEQETSTGRFSLRVTWRCGTRIMTGRFSELALAGLFSSLNLLGNERRLSRAKPVSKSSEWAYP